MPPTMTDNGDRMRFLKIAAWVIAGIVGLAIVGVALVAIFFDPNDYKADIERLVAEKTGRTFTLSGDLKLSVFPWLAVQVGPATLGNAPGFGDAPMVAIEGARLGVRLRPLFGGRFEIGAVQLDAPRFVLIKTAEGNNWSDIGEEDDTTSPSEEASSGKLDASVASITIKNGSLSYEDRAAGTTTLISDFNFSTGKLEPGEPFDLDTRFKLQRSSASDAAGTNIETQMTANVTADLETSRYQLSKPDIKLLLKGGDYPKEGLPVSLTATNIVADLEAQTAQVSSLAMEAAGAKLSADLQATQLIDAPSITGTIKLAPTSLRELAPKFGITLPQTSDAKAFTRFSMEAGLAATSKTVAFKPLTLHLDDTTMTGSAGVADLDSMALRFDLAVDRINADRYLPPKVEPAAEKSPKPDTKEEPTPIPVELIRDLNMRGKLAINECIFSGVKLTGVNVSIDAEDGKLQLSPMQAMLYEGKYRGNITVDARGKQPQLSLEQHLDGINFAPLVEALYQSKRLIGRGSINMKLAGNGPDTDAIKKTLDGTLDFSVNNGAVNGFDLWYEIRRARAVLKQQAIPTRSGPEQTSFTNLRGSAVVTDGVLNNQDLVAALQYLKVTGQGSINMVSNAIDYRLNAAVLKIPAEDKMAEQTQDIVGLTIPVRITGTISDPKVRPDLEGLLKEKAKQKIDEEKQKLEEKLKNKLQDKLKGLLGKRDATAPHTLT